MLTCTKLEFSLYSMEAWKNGCIKIFWNLSWSFDDVYSNENLIYRLTSCLSSSSTPTSNSTSHSETIHNLKKKSSKHFCQFCSGLCVIHWALQSMKGGLILPQVQVIVVYLKLQDAHSYGSPPAVCSGSLRTLEGRCLCTTLVRGAGTFGWSCVVGLPGCVAEVNGWKIVWQLCQSIS